MFALCDWMDKKGYGDSSPNQSPDGDSNPNEYPDRVKEEERCRIIGQNPKNGSSILFVSRNRKKRIQFLGQQLVWQDVSTPWPKLWVKKRNRLLGQEIADAWSRAPWNPTNLVKKILSEETHRQKAKYTVKPFSPFTLPKYCCCMLSLSQFKEGRKERKKKKDTFMSETVYWES